jgi:hypothetical protein
VRFDRGGIVRASWALLTVALFGCSSATEAAPKRTVPKAAPIVEADVLPEWGREAKKAANGTLHKPTKVEVRGIQGTLHNFDVRVTMEKKSREFAACHEPRASRVPPLSGTIEFAIQVKSTGEVMQVDLRTSDVGDRPLERCLIDVIRATQFPKPNGGDAKVSYTMLLGPARKGREPEQWDADRVRRILSKHVSDVSEKCELPRGGAYTITAYVDAQGRILAAGVTSPAPTESEQFDCIADSLRRWSMPRPSKKKFAKVTFPLRAVKT